MKKATFTSRLVAYIIDFIIVSLIANIIIQGFTTKKIEKLNNELESTITEYTKGELQVNEYIKKTNNLTYKIEKESMPINIVYIVIYIGYFIIFQFLNKGQTVGKKLMKIKVLNKDEKNVSLTGIIIRALFINQILSNLLLILIVAFLPKTAFFSTYYLIVGIQYLFLIITSIMMLYTKDKLALQDLMSKTIVVKEGKTNE